MVYMGRGGAVVLRFLIFCFKRRQCIICCRIIPFSKCLGRQEDEYNTALEGGIVQLL